MLKLKAKMALPYLVFIWATVTSLTNAVPLTSSTIGQLKVSYDNGLSLELPGFTAQLGLPPPGYNQLSKFRPCGPSASDSSLCLQTHGSSVNIQKAPTPTPVDCYTVTWMNPPSTQEDCVDLAGAYWYGGGELKLQHWPIQNLSQSRNAYVTGDFFHHPYGGVIERAWYSSKGYSIFVDEVTPLFLRFNQSGDNKMCFSASYDEYPYSDKYRADTKVLAYTVCTGQNVRQVVEHGLNAWIKKPRATVDMEVISQPIWSTWAKYKADINQEKVLEYAKEIHDNGFKASHVEVDDKWETCYGQLEFDLQKFPDPAAMVQKVKSYGFRVSFWVHPFVNLDCPAFKEGQEKGYFVKQLADPSKAIKTTWWNGDAGYIDFTNKNATDWYIGRLQKAQNLSGLNTYKFDAGELHWLENGFLFSDAEIMKRPTLFTQKYTQTAARFGPGVEVRVAYKSQDLPIFIRMLDKDSKWDYDNGLKTLITTALLFSVHGYAFTLPDMIGGNAYGDVPEKELFIRWLQANVFMPSLQFSITPWAYDKETIDISKKMVELHESLSPTFVTLSQEAVSSGKPIIRPLWWNDPKDENALLCDTQYLLGDDFLVAPVLEQGARKRDIYFPRGNWRAQMDGDTKVYVGPTWVRDYPGALHQLPFFKKA